MTTPKTWWSTATVRRLLADLMAAEIPRLGPVRRAPEAGEASPRDHSPGPDWDLDLGRDLDSLEFLDLATAVAVQFHLYQTGLDAALMASRRLDDWVATILRSRARWDESISFQTSGSTGRPRRCTHPLAFLEQEIDFTAERLRDRRRLISVVPCHHIYGFLFTIMLPTRLGMAVLDRRGALPGHVLRQAEPGDVLIGHPTFFDLATRAPVALAADVVAVSSTGHCPRPVWERLGTAGLAAMIEVYGASETAGIGVREAPGAPFRLMPPWSRVAGADGRLVRPGLADGPVVAELPDRVRWVDEDRFHVLGRRDGAVQVGGINVFPRRVQGRIREHPEVAEALVRLASGDRGGRLKAFVVPGPGCRDPAGLPGRLHAWLAGCLTAAERPATITIGPRLPRSPLGKPTDWE